MVEAVSFAFVQLALQKGYQDSKSRMDESNPDEQPKVWWTTGLQPSPLPQQNPLGEKEVLWYPAGFL